jgi:nitrate/nitrite transport system permease protein
MTRSLTFRAALVSIAIFALFVTVWQLAILGSGPTVPMDPEYASARRANASQGKSAMPGPLDVWLKIWEHLKTRSTTAAPTTRASASSSPGRSQR